MQRTVCAPREQVGREREVALGGEAVGRRADVVGQPERLVEHDDAGRRARGLGLGQVAGSSPPAGRGEADVGHRDSLEPDVDEPPRDGQRAGDMELAAAVDRRLQLVARVNQRASSSSPSRARGLAAGVAAREAEHERAREGPRLRGDVARVGDLDARLLEHLARHGLLERLARLDEAGQRAVAAGRPGRLAAEQDAVAVDDEHDHHRVGARVVVGAAGGAACAGSPPRRPRCGAPQTRAVRVGAVPVAQRDGVGGQAALGCAQPRGGVAQAGTAAAPSPAGVGGEQRHAVLEAEQHALARGFVERHAREAVAVEQRRRRRWRDGAAGRVGGRSASQRGVAAALAGAVERGAGEGDQQTALGVRLVDRADDVLGMGDPGEDGSRSRRCRRCRSRRCRR